MAARSPRGKKLSEAAPAAAWMTRGCGKYPVKELPGRLVMHEMVGQQAHRAAAGPHLAQPLDDIGDDLGRRPATSGAVPIHDVGVGVDGRQGACLLGTENGQAADTGLGEARQQGLVDPVPWRDEHWNELLTEKRSQSFAAIRQLPKHHISRAMPPAYPSFISL